MTKNIQVLIFYILNLNAFNTSKWRCGHRQLESGVGSSKNKYGAQVPQYKLGNTGYNRCTLMSRTTLNYLNLLW